MIEKIAKGMFKAKWIIIILFTALTVFCGIMMTKVKINSDIATYLPDDSMSKKTVKFMEENFNIKGDAIIAIDKSISDIDAVTAVITNVTKVDMVSDQVLWIGQFEDLFKVNGVSVLKDPTKWDATMKEIGDKYYKVDKDGKGTFLAYLQLEVSNSSDETSKVLDNVLKVLNDSETEYFLGGNAMQSKTMLDSALGDLPKFLIVAGCIILLILFLTTKSFVDPFIFLIVIGVSILINLGTNFFGDISTVTFSAAAILQLALAMDYSIFLTHAYNREIENGEEENNAMAKALKKTLVTVSASALTTVAGFVALFAMKFGLGANMGWVLAKGVVFSLITVVVLQPCLMLCCKNLIKKTTHKSFNPEFKLLQKSPSKIKYVAVIIALLLVVPAVIGQTKVEYYYLNTFNDDSAVGAKKVVQDLGSQLVVAVPDGNDRVKQGEFLTELKKLNTADEKRINDITGYYTFVDPSIDLVGERVKIIGTIKALGIPLGENPTDADLLAGIGLIPDNVDIPGIGNTTMVKMMLKQGLELISMANDMKPTFIKEVGEGDLAEDYTFYTLMIDGTTEGEKALATLDKINEIVGAQFKDKAVYVAGNTQVVRDVGKTTTIDFIVVSALSAILILVILMITFGSAWVPILLVVVIELGIFINLSITAMLGASINFMTYIIISAIELGATVDYAILMTSRLKDNIKSLPKEEAVKLAVKQSALSIIISCMILVSACLSVYFLAGDIIIREITLMIARGSAISAVLTLVLLPCIFLFLPEKSIMGKKALREKNNAARNDDNQLSAPKDI